MSHRVSTPGVGHGSRYPVQPIEVAAVTDDAGSEAPVVAIEAITTPSSLGVAISRRGGRPRKPKIWDRHQRRLTRGGAARELGVNVSTVRRMEARGELVPEIDEVGIRWFSYYEVRALKQRRLRRMQDKGTEVQIAAFELFRKGIDWRDVAIRLHCKPVRVYRLWRLYSTDDGAQERTRSL